MSGFSQSENVSGLVLPLVEELELEETLDFFFLNKTKLFFSFGTKTILTLINMFFLHAHFMKIH